MKRKLVILLVMIGIMKAVLWFEGMDKIERRDPFEVGKKFVYGLMYQEKTVMKSWSKNIGSIVTDLEKDIDEMEVKEYPIWYTFGGEDGPAIIVRDKNADYENLKLVSFRLFYPMMVCTYEYDQLEDPCNKLFYTVVLINPDTHVPMNGATLWEKIRLGLHNFLSRIGIRTKYPSFKPRWQVVDYYTEDDFFVMRSEELKNLEKRVKETKKNRKMSREERKALDGQKKLKWEKQFVGFKDRIGSHLEKVGEYKAKCLDAEFIRQYREAKEYAAGMDKLE